MTRADALRDLLEKVEAGWFDATDTRAARFNDFWRLAEVALGDVRGIPALTWDAYNKHSLDAAKALHETVLPGWDWGRSAASGQFYAWNTGEGPASAMSNNEDPARAWLICILKALIAAEDN